MAINKREDDVHQTLGADAAASNGANVGQPGAGWSDNNTMQLGATSLGFGQMPGLMAGLGNAKTMETAKALKEIFDKFAENNSKMKLNVMVLDKEVFTMLLYSCIVVSGQSAKTGKVYYYIMALEATGNRPQTMQAYMSDVNMLASQPNRRIVTAYTIDDTIDKEVHRLAVGELMKKYGDKVELISVDGLVVPTDYKTEDILRLAMLASSPIITEAKLGVEVPDINIAEAVRPTRGPNGQMVTNETLKIEHTLIPTTISNEVGRPVRADWRIELKKFNTRLAELSPNQSAGVETLVKAAGFVTATPTDVTPMDANSAMYGTPQSRVIRLQPSVVITDLAVINPTISYLLLGLSSAAVMANKSMYLASLLNNPYAGVLNMITNIDGKQGTVGDPIDLQSKKLAPEQRATIIKQMFPLPVSVSMDVQVYGPATPYQSVLARAAEGNRDAAQCIIDTANHLTNGKFPRNFPVEKIIYSSIYVPAGTWPSKAGERDIRDIDLAFVAEHTKDMNYVYRWARSDLRKEETSLDPFITKCDIISKIIPDAILTGKFLRVSFTGEFITTLTNAVAAAGLNSNFEPETLFTDGNDVSMFGGYLSSTGINSNNVTPFANHVTQHGPAYNAYAMFGSRW